MQVDIGPDTYERVVADKADYLADAARDRFTKPDAKWDDIARRVKDLNNLVEQFEKQRTGDHNASNPGDR